jgi:hypothetical protein
LFRRLRQKVSRSWKHLAKTGRVTAARIAGVASHENPNGRRNTHWLVDVRQRDASTFQVLVRKFLKKLVAVDDLGRGLLFQRVDTAGSYLKYMLKGVDQKYGDYFYVRPVDQGFIGGRGRTSVSRSIGHSARKKANWSRRRIPGGQP